MHLQGYNVDVDQLLIDCCGMNGRTGDPHKISHLDHDQRSDPLFELSN
jgi:hypothetical protein